LEEAPLISSQFSYNKAYGYLACEHCMYPLETAEQNLRRLTFNPTVALPYKEADSSLKIQDSIVECPETKAKFCSASCFAEADKKYHKLVGPHLTPGQALDYVNELWK
jgi:SET and MYND domain-containing protein 5